MREGVAALAYCYKTLDEFTIANIIVHCNIFCSSNTTPGIYLEKLTDSLILLPMSKNTAWQKK